MFSQIFENRKVKADTTAIVSKLNESLQFLERKEKMLEKKMDVELEKLTLVESASVTTQTVDALRTGAAKLKEVQKKANINSVDKTLDEFNEQAENLKLIQDDALSAPIGAAADFNEDKLEMELEELDALGLEDGKFLSAATTASISPVSDVPEKSQPTRPTPQKDLAKVDELTALQAQMVL